MPAVRIRNQKVYVGKTPIPLLCGEIHYWRLNPSVWKTVLRRAQGLGLEIISTYVPWQFHEFDRGTFDFTGRTDPRRNLLRFLELTRSEGFRLLVRPGPYIYSEWPNDGVPDYAASYHKLHPQFLAWARDYIRVVTEVIRPYQASRPGGHILMVQADNEIDAWPDRHGAQYGLGEKPGLFQQFVKNKYGGNLARLNRAWGTRFREFDEAGPFMSLMVDVDSDSPRGFPLKGDAELRRNLDFFSFKHFYAEEYARWVVSEYRRSGIDVPVYVNTYPFFYAHDWRALQHVSDLAGIDVYARNEFQGDESDHRKTMDKLRIVRRISSAAFIAEFGCGVWHGEHYQAGALTPNHYRLLTVSALLGGATGWNWYMLVNRDNWYMSPINEWGRVREELFDVCESLVHAYRRMQPADCEKISGVGVTFHPMHYAAKTLRQKGSVLEALYRADIDYHMFDPGHDEMTTPILFYSGNQWLPAKAQKRLRDYVRKGGVLVAFQDWPRRDEDFRLSGMLGFEEPGRNLFEFKRKVEFSIGRENVKIESAVLTFSKVKGKPLTADLGAGFGEAALGYIKKMGRGEIVHVGVEPAPELLHALLRHYRIPLACHSLTPGIQSAVFARGRRRFLLAVHNGHEEKTATLRIQSTGRGRKKYALLDLLSGKIAATTSERESEFTFRIGRKDGRLFEITLR